MFLCPEQRTALNKLFQKDWESFKSSPHQTACLEYPINLLCNSGKKHKDGKKHIKSKLVYWWFVYQRFWMRGGAVRGVMMRRETRQFGFKKRICRTRSDAASLSQTRQACWAAHVAECTRSTTFVAFHLAKTKQNGCLAILLSRKQIWS